MARLVLMSVAAVVANALGWLLPVMDKYRGWQAFRVGLSPLWPYEKFDIHGFLILLSVGSALTNVVFVIAALALVLPDLPNTRLRSAFWVVLAAAALNLHWPISMGDNRGDLLIGYYVWLLSFPLLAIALKWRADRA